MKFSIIIPAFNASNYIANALHSIYKKNAALDISEFEVIICDDGSEDGTYRIIEDLKGFYPNLVLIRSLDNHGPGVARNACLEIASGEWVLFLDSDDEFMENGLVVLSKLIDTDISHECDLVLFNQSVTCFLNKDIEIREYLKLRRDGSVIFSCVKKELINRRALFFENGLHEDVDFQFKLLYHCKTIYSLSTRIYKKNSIANSIVNTISERHLKGFIRAWGEIYTLISKNEKRVIAYKTGFVGVVFTRIRSILNSQLDPQFKASLLGVLYILSNKLLERLHLNIKFDEKFTKYYIVTSYFFSNWEVKDMDNCIKDMEQMMKKSWSCKDLQKSIFLGPDEIRTCCKRFFVNGEMRGDVVLFKTNSLIPSDAQLIKAKKSLIERINTGESNECGGCPYLEFGEWPKIEEETFNYISFEYHSICNLKCEYCSDKYYGGDKPNYDVEFFIDSLCKNNHVDNEGQFIWGGGEPTNIKSFAPMILDLTRKFPKSNHRVLTNSVKYSTVIQDLLDDKKIELTTSIDAGTKETYEKIRGSNKFIAVLKNLKKYSVSSPELITIKYIFTEGNVDLSEIRSFVNSVKEFGLLGSNFQISYNFKEESIPLHTLKHIISLYSILQTEGAEVIFMDDLIINRISKISDHELNMAHEFLGINSLASPFADSSEYPIVDIWGAGWYTKFLLENSAFFKISMADSIYDDTPNKKNKLFCNKIVKDTSAITQRKIPILISAVQGYPTIYRKALRYGIPRERIIKKLII